jgi:hypothetical protein
MEQEQDLTPTFCLVKNLESHIRSVRIKRPSSRYFSLSNVPMGVRLAPGMAASFDVSYSPPKDPPLSDIIDSVTVSTETGSITIPLRCPAPRSSIRLTGDLDFGIVPSGATLSRDVLLHNSGELHGEWILATDGDLPVSISPSTGRLEPGCEQTVTVTMKDVDTGQVAADLVLSSTGMPNPAKYATKVMAVMTSLDILEADGKLATEVRVPALGGSCVPARTLSAPAQLPATV